MLLTWIPKENHPSPEWVANHGLNIFVGVNSLKPQKEWNGLRQEKNMNWIKKRHGQEPHAKSRLTAHEERKYSLSL
jgi:hypothetical protein